jgi:hypothetical protein
MSLCVINMLVARFLAELSTGINIGQESPKQAAAY